MATISNTDANAHDPLEKIILKILIVMKENLAALQALGG